MDVSSYDFELENTYIIGLDKHGKSKIFKFNVK